MSEEASTTSPPTLETEASTTTPAPAPAPTAEAVVEGGEKLSKNALKKKLKAERAAKLKAEKEAAKVSRDML